MIHKILSATILRFKDHIELWFSVHPPKSIWRNRFQKIFKHSHKHKDKHFKAFFKLYIVRMHKDLLLINLKAAKKYQLKSRKKFDRHVLPQLLIKLSSLLEIEVQFEKKPPLHSSTTQFICSTIQDAIHSPTIHYGPRRCLPQTVF